MSLPKNLTTVTPFSKYLAMVLFILLPFLGFYLGVQYQKSFNYIQPNEATNKTSTDNSKINPSLSEPTQVIQEMNGITIPPNWKTFNSSYYHFTMKYPNNWTYEVRNNNAQVSFDVPSDIEKTDGLVRGKVTLEINSPNRKVIDIDDAIKESIKYTISKPQSIKKFRIGDFSVAEVHHQACPDNSDCINVIFYMNDTIFSMYSNAENERYLNLPIIYQMISTFSLLEK